MTNTLTSEIPHQAAADVAREAAIAAYYGPGESTSYESALAFICRVQYDEDDGSGCSLYASLDFEAERRHHRYAAAVYRRHIARLVEGQVTHFLIPICLTCGEFGPFAPRGFCKKGHQQQ